MKKVLDPILFKKKFWPHIDFYKQQIEILYSVRDNYITVVPAGHMLGKDFITAFTVLWYFTSRDPCRIVTTSVDSNQLEGVLWGEIGRFLDEARGPLPIKWNHLHLKKMVGDNISKNSYAIGRVTPRGGGGEGLSGHHLDRSQGDRTLFVIDEASGVDHIAYEKGLEWAHRVLVIGNPYPCENFFKWAVKGRPGSDDRGGDIKREDGEGYTRKVIKITADDSPNVRRAKAQIAAGQKPDNQIIVPGVLPYEVYRTNKKLWDPIKQSAGMWAEFYEGSEVLLFPPDWLDRAERIAAELPERRQATAMGVDPAEGGDSTSYTFVDERGIIDQVSIKTPNTVDVVNYTLGFINEYKVPPSKVVFDRGGGGKQHADRLRAMGYPVKTVPFGGAPSPEKSKGAKSLKRMVGEDEVRKAYKDKRAEMYGNLSDLLDPINEKGFGIPEKLVELRRQLSPIPKLYDDNGVLYLPPKNRKLILPGGRIVSSLVDTIGHSPDEADSAVLAAYSLTMKRKKKIGALI